MRIVKIEFENISNLKGKHYLNFEEKPLSDADIFAIIGPTGAGKSTILDVITLALFNKIPRLDHISKNTIEKEGSIITKNENHAEAKVSYKINHHEYTSVWYIDAKKRGEGLADYKMELFVDGQLIDLKKSEVPAENEKIIGLNYEQFTKAILLSQGEFSKFLKSNKDEKNKLLEKITGTSIYRELGKKAHEIYREQKEKIELLQKEIQLLQTFTPEEIQTLKQKIENIDTTIQKNHTQLLELNNWLQIQKRYKELQEQTLQLKTLQTKNQTAIELFSTQEQQLQWHLIAQPFKRELKEYSKKKEQIKNNNYTIEQLQNKEKNNLQNKQNFFFQLESIIKETANENNYSQKIHAFTNKLIQLTQEIEHIEKEGKNAKNNIDQHIQSSLLQAYNFAKLLPTQLLLSVEQAIQELQQLLSQHHITNSNNIQAIEQQKKQLEERIEDYKTIILFAENVTEIDEHNHLLSQEAAHIHTQIIEHEQRFPSLIEKEKSLQKSIQELEQQKIIASYEEKRKELINGEACPLCGATHHPYTEQHLADMHSTTSLLEEQQTHLKTIIDTIHTTQQNIALLKEKKQFKEENIHNNNNKKQALEKTTLQQLHQTITLKNIHLENIRIQQKEALQQKQIVEKIIKAIPQIEALQQLKNAIQNRNILVEKYQTCKKNRDLLFPEKDFKTILNNLEGNIQNSIQSQYQISSALSSQKSLLNEQKESMLELETSLKTLINKQYFNSIEAIEKAILADEQVSAIEQQKEKLYNEKEKINTLLNDNTIQIKGLASAIINIPQEMSEVEKSIINYQENNEQLQQEKGRIEQQLDDNFATEQNKKQLEQHYRTTQKVYAKWEKLYNLIGDSAGKTFSTFAQGLTLKHLIAHCNQRLQKLSDRYLLYIEPLEQEIIVIDQLQGNSDRSVKTLSGGETFLVSLALALSLSDMASKNIQLESLFIDEGFGTLDENTLEQALSLLEKLQNESNKKVGVISHVKELKERIGVQILLQKDSQGYSAIKIIG